MPETVKNRVKFDNYMWNYNRLSEPLQKDFLERISKEFREDLENGGIDRKLYPGNKWDSFIAVSEGNPPGTSLPEGKEPDRSFSVTAAWTREYLKQRGFSPVFRKMTGKQK